MDAPLEAAQRFTVYLVRFQLLNDSGTGATLEPVLEFAGGYADWTAMPMVDPERGTAFYGASDDGSMFNARQTTIEVSDLRLAGASDPLASAVPGQSSAGLALAAVELPGHSFTEIEFAVRATVDAAWGVRYRFRLVDPSSRLPGVEAELIMGAKPALDLSPGQREGTPVDEPVPLYRLDPSIGSSNLPMASSTDTGPTATYALVQPFAAATSQASPHVVSGLASDTCASCHATHEAQGPMLLRRAGSAVADVLHLPRCGRVPATNVQQDWSNPLIPANDPATSAWYSHPATTPSDHSSAQENEFGGVLNRHTACADCHQPHLADDSRPVNSVAGWTASGAIAGASGVSVENGAAGTAPTYTLETTSSFEYQLCYKCHSGFTQLPAQDPAHPSRWALDKGVELNPANVSYHPVEAAGKNQTPAMALSLAGTSPYKLWAFETDGHGPVPQLPWGGFGSHGDSGAGRRRAPGQPRLGKPRGPDRAIQGSGAQRPRALPGPELRALLCLPR